MTDVAVKAINAGDERVGDGIEHARRRVRRVVRQRVRGNRPLRFRQTKSRHRARRARQSSSLRGQKVQQASTAALKRAEAHQEARLFKSLFGGGQSASEEESNDVDSATEIDEFADERSQSDDDAPARNRNRNRLRRTFPSPTSTSTSTHPPTRKRAHHVGIYVFHLFIASRPIPSPRRSTGARVSPPGPRRAGNQTTLSTVTDVTFERARVRPSRAFDAPLSRDMTRDFLVPDSFADLCVDDDDDDDETRGVVANG